MNFSPVLIFTFIIASRSKSVAFLVNVSLICLFILPILMGCRESQIDPQPKKQESSEVEEKEKDVTGPITLWTPARNRSWTELTSSHDTWELCFIQGSHVGYMHTQIKPVTLQSGEDVVQIETATRLQMQRFGQQAEVDFTIRSNESPRGELVSFVELMKNGPNTQATQARVEGDQLRLSVGDSQPPRLLAWSVENGGFTAVEHSLLSAPMKPGEQRELRHLVPMFDVVAVTKLDARIVEPVGLLHGTYQLLRIDMTTTLPDGGSIEGTLWTDSKGEPLKTYTKLLDQETYRVTREAALAKYEPGRLDLGFGMLVKPDQPLKDPHAARQATYVVTLEDADPATVFTSGLSQSVESIGANTAKVTVRAVRPADITTDSDGIDPPSSADLAPNSLIESNDPVIRTMAQEAVQKSGKEGISEWEKAVAAERYVYETVEKNDYSQVFSTAVETARSGRGDCSEHAVLLAALGRSLGIPSRVVIGLVYSESLGAFGFHMWTEMYIGGGWIPMDATLGRGGIGIGHLRLGHTNLQNGLADSVFFALPKTLGKLKVQVERVESFSK